MKRIRVILLIASGFFFLVSCSKEKLSPTPQPEPAPVANEKLLISSNRHYNKTMEYYPDRKIKKCGFSSGGNQYLIEFTYGANTATAKSFINTKIVEMRVYQLNEKGHMTSEVFTIYDNNGSMTDQRTAQYFYNAAGQLVKETYSVGGRTDFIYDSKGNLKEQHFFDNNGEYGYHTYEYYEDKPAKYMSYGQFNSYGIGTLRPLLSKNLIKRQLIIDLPSQEITFDGTYTYELDADGFEIKGKYVNAINGLSHEWINVYQ